MDYLESKSTSKTQIFDIIGYSMGGQMAILLNSVDDRLNRVVICVAPLDFKIGVRLGMSEENTKKFNYLSQKIVPHYKRLLLFYLWEQKMSGTPKMKLKISLIK